MRRLRPLHVQRRQKLRALTWDHVFLKGRPDADPPSLRTSPCGARSGAAGHKTRKSRRTLALPARCVEVLWQQFEDQGWERLAAGDSWEEHGLAFSSAVGKPLDAGGPPEADPPVIQTGAVVMDGIFKRDSER